MTKSSWIKSLSKIRGQINDRGCSKLHWLINKDNKKTWNKTKVWACFLSITY